MADNFNIKTGTADGNRSLRTTDVSGNHVQHVSLDGAEAWGGATRYQAKVSEDGEVATTSTERERNLAVVYAEAGVSADKYVILVDLSDTTNFPHGDTGRIDISTVRFEVDKASNAQGSVQIGVITRIDGTNADISYLTKLSFINSTSNLLTSFQNWAPSQLKFGVSGGNLTKAITNDTETNVAAVNTGATLDSPRGASTVTPAVGDIVLKLGHSAGGTYDVDVEAMYHSEVGA